MATMRFSRVKKFRQILAVFHFPGREPVRGYYRTMAEVAQAFKPARGSDEQIYTGAVEA